MNGNGIGTTTIEVTTAEVEFLRDAVKMLLRNLDLQRHNIVTVNDNPNRTLLRAINADIETGEALALTLESHAQEAFANGDEDVDDGDDIEGTP